MVHLFVKLIRMLISAIYMTVQILMRLTLLLNISKEQYRNVRGVVMQTGWLIYSKSDAKENKSFINWCMEEASLQDINLKLVLHEDIEIGVISNQLSCQINGQPTNLPDIAIVRTIDFLLS